MSSSDFNDHQRLSWPRSIFLHLAPGLAIFLAYVGIGVPIADSFGLPSIAGFFIASLIALFPWQLGALFFLGYRRNGRWSLEGIIQFRQILPWGKLTVLVVGLCLWGITVVMLFPSLDTWLKDALFAWFPVQFVVNDFQAANYAPLVLIAASLVNLFFFGIAAPAVEELYFRGYLLPQMAHLGPWAPLIHPALFTLYHVWSPWLFISRMLFGLPMIWAVWHYKSLSISLWVHIVMNSLGIILSLAAALSI